MIASGGETAAMLSTLPIAELRLVDVNWSQLHLIRLKFQLLTTANRSERLQLLGHLPMDADRRSGELTRRMFGGIFSYHHCISQQKTGGWMAEKSVFPASIYLILRISS